MITESLTKFYCCCWCCWCCVWWKMFWIWHILIKGHILLIYFRIMFFFNQPKSNLQTFKYQSFCVVLQAIFMKNKSSFFKNWSENNKNSVSINKNLDTVLTQFLPLVFWSIFSEMLIHYLFQIYWNEKWRKNGCRIVWFVASYWEIDFSTESMTEKHESRAFCK